jgi:hypothetical protein
MVLVVMSPYDLGVNSNGELALKRLVSFTDNIYPLSTYLHCKWRTNVRLQDNSRSFDSAFVKSIVNSYELFSF